MPRFDSLVIAPYHPADVSRVGLRIIEHLFKVFRIKDQGSGLLAHHPGYVSSVQHVHILYATKKKAIVRALQYF